MAPVFIILCALGLGLVGWFTARAKARTLFTGRGSMHSLPSYHGWNVALWIILPALVIWSIWQFISPGLIEAEALASPAAAALPDAGMLRSAILSEAQKLADDPDAIVFNPAAKEMVPAVSAAVSKYNWIGAGLTLLFAFVGGAYAFSRVKAAYPARSLVERTVMTALFIASLIAILTTFGIIASLIFETGVFFSYVSPIDFLFGTHWAPDPFAPVTDNIGDKYGAIPLFWGTIFIGAIIAMIVAIPLGLMSAIYLTQYANPACARGSSPRLRFWRACPLSFTDISLL